MLKGAEALVLALSGAALRTAYIAPGAPVRRQRQSLDRLLDRAGVALRHTPTDGLALSGALGEALLPGRPTCVFTGSAGLGALLAPLSQGGLLNEYRSPVVVIELMEAPGPGSTPGGPDSRAGLAAVPLPVFEPGSADEVFHLLRLAAQVSGLGGLPVVVRVPVQTLDDRCEVRAAAEGPPAALRASRSETSLGAAMEAGAEPPIFFSRSSWAYHHGRRLRLLRELDGLAAALTSTAAGQGIRGAVLAGHVGPLVQARAAALGLPTLRLGLCWPLPEEVVLRFLRPLSEVLVLEEGGGFLLTQLQALCQRARLGGQALWSAGEQQSGSGVSQPGAASEGVEAALVRFALKGRAGGSLGGQGEGRAGQVKGHDLEGAQARIAGLGPRLDERGELDLEPWGLYVARTHQAAVGEDEAVPGLLDLLRQLRQLPRQVVIAGGAGGACEQALHGHLLDIRLHGGSAAAVAGGLAQAAGPVSTSSGEAERGEPASRSQAGPPLVVALIDGDGPLWEELLGAMDNARQGRDVLHVLVLRASGGAGPAATPTSAAVIEAQLRAAGVEVISAELTPGGAAQVSRALGYIAWRSGPRALCCLAPAAVPA